VDPKVTVCIPTWNGERYIAESVQSVLAQSFTDLEVIITDDRSTGSTVEIVRSFGNPRIGLHENEERLGIRGNWNRAMSLTRVMYVEQDLLSKMS
jgi:glycosyltransferase involved in cell wall biosynthesis